ncbi:MAG: FG-GAP-like repeat-containing protein [Myxococcota bacterium]
MGACPRGCLLFPFLLLLPPSLAELPLPTYPECGEVDRDDLCPSDLRGEWSKISYVPSGSRDTVRAAELDMGSGNHADRAWRVTTGRVDVTIAILDSGINWGSNEYQNKIALNTDELPLPQLADGTQASVYDVDGNGMVNVRDYAEDPRVTIESGRDMADWQLDASDLLAAFSDGVDDDGNGFTDDIAGWDFFGDDNDPYHEYADGHGTHGDGVIEEAAAEGGDDSGNDIGVCPNCAVLPVRIGDTFVTDGSRASMGMLYAIDRGAVAVNMSVGALSNPDVAWATAKYARENGVTLVGAAGDENAYHHNFPAMMDGILYVHSIRANTDDEYNGAYSYLNFFNCNNYGPRIVLVADSSACATGASAITTATAGLVHSAARDAGLTLTADEVYQILVATVDDVNLSAEEVAEAITYPSGEGWDPFFGYGRINAGKAVSAVAAGAIPPTMDISAPAWFQTIDPTVGSIAIEGYVSADRSASFDYVIDVGVGHDPREWTEVASGNSTQRIDGTLATLDLTTLQVAAIPDAPKDETLLERMDRVFADAVTVRIRATDAEGRVGQFQKTFFVVPDPDLLPGFPLQMGASGESSPILADLDDDGIFEILIGDSGGRVHAYTGTGAELDGFPVLTDPNPFFRDTHAGVVSGDVPTLYDGFVSTVAVGDLDGDGSPEIVGATGWGRVYAWHADGSRVDGFPVETLGRQPEEFDADHSWDMGFAGAPTLYDLDGDGTLEIVAAAMDQRMYVWDATGADWGPYPIEVCEELCGEKGSRIIASPTIGDVDGDGDVEIGIGTNEAVNDGNASVSYLYDALTGTLAEGWPVEESGLVNEAALLPIVGEGHPASMAFADLDHDGDLEIASPIMLGTSPIFDHAGEMALDLSYISGNYGDRSNVDEPSFVQMTNNPAFGDMTGDGVPEYVIGSAGVNYLITLPLTIARDWTQVVAAWDGVTGEMLPGWPRAIEDLQFLVAPAVADLDGDAKAEAIMGSAGYLLHAWDEAGEEPEGWPKFTGNWILGSPAVGDIDGDGYVEVVVSTREGNVFAWSTKGRADQDVGWAGIHHDPQNTGNHETPLAKQAGPPDGPPVEEGGCCNKNGNSAAMLWLAPLAMLWRRRRARD